VGGGLSPPPPPPTQLDWERHPTFRHTFLAHLPPDLAEAVEHLGRGLYQFLLAHESEASCLSPTDALLSDRAQAWSTQAEALATRIEGALP
jgi:hypothetical protein